MLTLTLFGILVFCVIVISGLAVHGATKGEKAFRTVIVVNVTLAVFMSINGLIFYSMLNYGGYQIMLSFYLVPAVLILQLGKIILSFRLKLGNVFSYSTLLVFLLLGVPFLLFVAEEMDLLYHSSALIYFVLALYHLLECFYVWKQQKLSLKNEVVE